jgi:leucyl-tRNA synthetase
MSKSKNNGVLPEDVIDRLGADTMRLFVLFKAPPDHVLDWDERAIQGQTRWIRRLVALVDEHVKLVADRHEATILPASADEIRSLRALRNETIEAVTRALTITNAFNVAIASLMKLSNALRLYKTKSDSVYYESLRTLLLLVCPMAPHVSAELWQRLVCVGPKHASAWAGDSVSLDVHEQSWPRAESAEKYAEKSVDIVVQISGRRRGIIKVPSVVAQKKDDLERFVLASEVAEKYIRRPSCRVIKSIVLPERKLVNLVVSSGMESSRRP